MALVTCPECGKNVSSSALTCPECGFSVKEYYDTKAKEAADLEEFNRTHKDLVLNDDGWFMLFTTYDYIVKRVAETSKNLLKYRKIWFNQGIPSYPLDFGNGWWTCIEDGYVDIIKLIIKEMGNFPNAEIKSNLKQLQQYDFRTTMRSILLRWNQLIMAPFDNNSPAILQKAEHNYSLEVARESQMGFGIITNSITSMALYAVQSSMKETRAINKAEENKQNYINSAMSFMQQNVSKAWGEHFDEFLKDVELLHQLVIFELGNIVFKGYLFAWSLVDNEFIKPEKKQMYITKKAQREAKAAEEKKAKTSVLDSKRQQYITAKAPIVDKAKQELSQYQTELETLGFALWGEKAEKKRQLKMKIAEKQRIISQIEPCLNATRRKYAVNNQSYVHFIFSGWNKYLKMRIKDICKVVYNENANRYDVISESGVLVEQLPSEFTTQYGVYREFTARYDNCIVSYENNIEHHAQIFLTITSVD